MANLKVRATALTYLKTGRPLAAGDEVSVPEMEARRLADAGVAVLVAQPKKIEKKESK